jgi:hypothetical protein
MHDSRRLTRALLLGLLCLPVIGCGDDGPSTPPGLRPPALGPTTFIDPDILTATDSSAFTGVVANGQGSRTMFDRRTGGEVTVDAWLFDASYDDGLTAEIQVNPEFADSVAAEIAEKYGRAVGRLPNALRAGLDEVWIHDGEELFGAFDASLLVHLTQAEIYEMDGFLEEALMHQAVHVSLDAAHAASPGWLEAQELDNGFISQNAQDAPTTEDVAESFIPYVAVVYGGGRVTSFLQGTIIQQIPARLGYLDDLGLDMYPVDTR